MAAEWMGWENVFYCELDQFLRTLLKQKWPRAQEYEDIKNTDFTIWKGRIDILTGGDPCQPSSVSGLRKGLSDERYLWPEYFRAVREVGPRFVVNENVYGSISNGILDQKIDDLESIGYTCWPPMLIPSNFLGAWHQRKRVWLVAYSTTRRREIVLCGQSGVSKKKSGSPITLDSSGNPFLQFQERMGEPPVLRVADGIPRRMDTIKRLGGTGNAIMPQIAYNLFAAIELLTQE